MSEIAVSIAFGLIPVGGFAVLLLVYNLTMSPARLQKESDEKIENLEKCLEKVSNKQEQVDEFSDFLSEGIHDIWNYSVESDNDLEKLEAYWKDWQKRVIKKLENHFNRADVHHFQRLGVVPVRTREDAYNNKHKHILMQYALKEERLREIIRDHNVTRI